MPARGAATENHGGTVKYMLMMNVPRGSGDYQIDSWSPEDLEAHMAFMHELNGELTDSGELAAGEALSPPKEARVVRADGEGLPVVSDGPFPETKEFLAGYWIVDVDSPDRAYRIAGRASAAPGPGGRPLNMPIEVRRVMSAPSVEG